MINCPNLHMQCVCGGCLLDITAMNVNVVNDIQPQLHIYCKEESLFVATIYGANNSTPNCQSISDVAVPANFDLYHRSIGQYQTKYILTQYVVQSTCRRQTDDPTEQLSKERTVQNAPQYSKSQLKCIILIQYMTYVKL